MLVSEGNLRSSKIDTKLNKHAAGFLRAFNAADAHRESPQEKLCAAVSDCTDPFLTTDPFFMRLIFL